ncbi:MAG: PRC-barrel domain-containing protein [Xanthobacteraceae bacterium]|nr:PRC-barrel domain-containing protein [Xanthobacteraceae bacterium]
MHSKLLIGGLLSSVVIVSAFAQSSPAPSPSGPGTPPAATPAPAGKPAETTAVAPAAKSGMWRASKLVGLNVYNDQNEKLGDISEILLDKSGKVEGVVIGVGGFLGMGQRDIKVEMSKLKFVDEPVKTSSNATTTTSTTGAGTNRPATTTTTTSASNDKKWYPDHAVLSGATKDQLKSMPEFKYN